MTDSTQEPEDSSDLEMILEVACNVADTLEQAVELGEEDLLRVALLTLERVEVEESVEVSLLVTDDDGLRELNREFRGRDEATDVLSFPLLDAPLVEAPADELWLPAEDGATGTPSAGETGQGMWLSGDVHGTAGVSESDTEAEERDDGEDAGEDGDDYEDTPLHLGDIAISRDAVVRQAAAAGHSVAWECAYLFAHGLLHLMGYDDSTDAGYRAMVAHQEAVLTEAHIAR
ncbi:MAG TPA: rRNA maturation RNase YbeY [Ktedonobacterales bacterium]|nr:rRNA maturation RNase YbeY [Ktedonobacterales bacterium]